MADPQNNENRIARKIMLFDLEIDGHHPIYIQHLLDYWIKNRPCGQLLAVVSPSFSERFSSFVNLPQANGVQFIPISPAEYAAVKNKHSKVARRYNEWRLMNRYAKEFNVDRCLIMYFDHLQLPFIFGETPPCPVSGIYFRPSFHYKNFSGYVPGYKRRVRDLLYWYMLARVLSRPYLKALFCLDPFGTIYIKRSIPDAKIFHLPDPVRIYDQIQLNGGQFRESLGVEKHRRVFLLFGSITKRKGVYRLLEAISLLPTKTSQRLCLIIVGPVKIGEEQTLLSEIRNLHQSTKARVVIKNEFISDRSAQSYFQIADVVVTPYQNHVGSSNVLVKAAAAAKPVLASDYGLLGEMVRRYRLGLTVNSSVPSEIAKGLIACMEKDASQLFDPRLAKVFVDRNSVNRFAHTVFQYL